MLQVVLVVVIGIIVAILFFATTRPDEFHVHRQTTIKAPRDRIFPFLTDFHRWTQWSPWENLDADLKRSYSGADSGEGAAYAWEGQKAGTGSMEIMRVEAPAEVLINLHFQKPMKAENRVEFTLNDDGGQTRVDWTMTGRAPYLHKLMTMFVSMDKIIGKQFEQGLAQLKAAAERA